MTDDTEPHSALSAEKPANPIEARIADLEKRVAYLERCRCIMDQRFADYLAGKWPTS